MLTDIRPLQVSANYRRLWVGNTVAQLGQQMTAVTIAIQVYAITGSTFAVGLVGSVRAGAAGRVRPVRRRVRRLDGPAQARARSRRSALGDVACCWSRSRRLDWSRCGSCMPSSPSSPASSPSTIRPGRAIIPRLIDAELLPAANALNMASFNLGFTRRPAARGAGDRRAGLHVRLLDRRDHVHGCDLCAACGCRRSRRSRSRGRRSREPGFKSVVEGLRFLRERARTSG